MPSQIVFLPEPIFSSLLNDHTIEICRAFGMRDMRLAEGGTVQGHRPLRVHFDPLVHCPRLRDHVVDDIYAVLLTSGCPDFSRPAPPPLGDSLTHYVLDEVEAAFQDVAELSGHEHMAIGEAFDRARRARDSRHALTQRSPQEGYPATLLAEADRIETIIAPALVRLNRRLESYRRTLQASGLPAAVARLGLQAELGLRLRLDRCANPHVPRLFGETRRRGLEALQRTTFNQLGCFQHMALAIHRAAIDNVNWLQVETLNGLHTRLLASLPGYEKAGQLRTCEMRIRSPFDGHVSVLEVQGPEVHAAFSEFADAFDAGLWREFHPVIRAAMAHMEFVRVHPYSDGNGRLARLLMQGVLYESDVPFLPLEAVLTWNRATYLDRAGRSVQHNDALGFVQFLLKMIDQAIQVGRHMVKVLGSHYQAVRTSLLDLGLSGRQALIAAEHSASMLIGPDPQLIQRTVHGVECCWFLEESGLFDAVDARFLNLTVSGYDCTTAFSSPVARSLLATPLVGV